MTNRTINKPLEFLENIYVWSEQAALHVAIAFSRSPTATPEMRRAAWTIAARLNTFLKCSHCKRAILGWEQHEVCRRQAASDEFTTWLDTDEPSTDRSVEFDELIEETIVNEVGDCEE